MVSACFVQFFSFGTVMSARARGRTGGRIKAFKDTRIDAITQAIKNNPDRKVEEICKEFGVSKTTYYRRKNESK